EKALVSDTNSEGNEWVKTDKPLPAAKKELAVTAEQLKPFIGEYELMPGFYLAITSENNQLYAQATGQQRFELYASTPTRFFLKVVEADVEFFPDAAGIVNRLVLYQGGQELEGKRVK
ncbi:MAG: DUF3471 domain-containing protein, partial [Saprospiraceae bacterium]|nr:DUF3471 domain-containing protein [Saprospiraceae bacterium]